MRMVLMKMRITRGWELDRLWTQPLLEGLTRGWWSSSVSVLRKTLIKDPLQLTLFRCWNPTTSFVTKTVRSLQLIKFTPVNVKYIGMFTGRVWFLLSFSVYNFTLWAVSLSHCKYFSVEGFVMLHMFVCTLLTFRHFLDTVVTVQFELNCLLELWSLCNKISTHDSLLDGN